MSQWRQYGWARGCKTYFDDGSAATQTVTASPALVWAVGVLGDGGDNETTIYTNAAASAIAWAVATGTTDDSSTVAFRKPLRVPGLYFNTRNGRLRGGWVAWEPA